MLSYILGLTFTLENISFTLILVAVTVIASIYAEQNPHFKHHWIFNAYYISHRKEYSRWLSHGFIHSGFMHLAFNMLAFYSFGEVLEYIFMQLFEKWGVFTGALFFVVFYFSAIVVSSLPSFIKHKNNPAYFALGASGGVSAVVMATILYFPTDMVYIFFIPMPGFMMAILYIFYSYYMSRNAQDNIGHDAHLFGALYGIAFMIAINPPVIFRFIHQIGLYF
jgi:membrane associated rhomboid family serine protease